MNERQHRELQERMDTEQALKLVEMERREQRRKWTIQHDDDHTEEDWIALLAVRLGQVADAMFRENWSEYVVQLIKLAAVATAAIEAAERAIDRPTEEELR